MDVDIVSLSRLQFALTALYHFLFVPLTLGLSILLAIMARPDADLLIVDDIDQLRSMELRNKLLVKLRDYSQLKPVIATSVNPDFTYLCHNHVTLTTDTYQITAVNQ